MAGHLRNGTASAAEGAAKVLAPEAALLPDAVPLSNAAPDPDKDDEGVHRE